LPARTNLWLCLLVGVSCLLIGFAATTLAYRFHFLHVPGGGRILERMNRELGLTPAQREQIGTIMHDARGKAITMRQDFMRQRHELFKQSFSQIRGVLTPEQQKKFDRDFSPRWARHGEYGDYEGAHDSEHPPQE
jgi:Spy/CpxP family protein refolding chaperone